MRAALFVLSLTLIAWGLCAEFILIRGGASIDQLKAVKQGATNSSGERFVYHLLKHRLLAAWLGGIVLLASIFIS